MSLQREILEARFPNFSHTFHIHFSERPAGISNVRPESRAFGWNLERSTEIPNIGLIVVLMRIFVVAFMPPLIAILMPIFNS